MIILIITTLILAGTLHMLTCKYDLFPYLKIPVSTRLFGENKTVRGFVVMSSCSGIFGFFFSFDIYTAFICFVLGLGYMLGELPNSYVKRRLNIQPGEGSFTSIVFDQLDSSTAISILLFVFGFDITFVISFFVLAPICFWLYKIFLFNLGLKSTPY